MIGFLVGTLCLLGLLRVLRKGRGGRRRHCEGGCGFRGHGWRFGGDGEWDPRGPRDDGDREYGGPYRSGPGDHGAEESGRAHRHDEEASGWRDRGGFGGKALLWEAFRRLDTTPGQEKVIRAVVDEYPGAFTVGEVWVDDNTQFILRIEWTSAEDHMEGFRNSPEFHEFFGCIRQYVKMITEMRHYNPLLISDS